MKSEREQEAEKHMAATAIAAALVLAARPTWEAGESVCPSFPGFEVADLYPIRSPLIVADFLAEQVRGRKFCEIGTRNGDVMGCVAHYASSVTAIEMDEGYCKKLRARGFTVACDMFEQIPVSTWPVADVYYWWPSDAGGQNELWLRILARALRARGARATVYIGADGHWKPDLQYLPELVRKYNGTVTRLFFDEGGALTGPAKASRIYQKATHKLEASVEKPFFDRPGHWGAFHVARFDVGPELWRRMRTVHFSHPEYAKWAQRNGLKIGTSMLAERARGGRAGRG